MLSSHGFLLTRTSESLWRVLIPYYLHVCHVWIVCCQKGQKMTSDPLILSYRWLWTACCGRWGMNSILWKSIKRHLYIPVKSVLFVLLCLHVTVWLYMHVCARRPEEEWDPWSWRYRDLWTTRPVMWELGSEPGSSQLCSQCFESLSHLSPQLRILNLYTCFFHKICEKF